MVKIEQSKSAERFDAAWEVEPGRVWLCPWMSIIGRQFLEPLVHMVLKSLENHLEGAYRNYDMVVPWKNVACPAGHHVVHEARTRGGS